METTPSPTSTPVAEWGSAAEPPSGGPRRGVADVDLVVTQAIAVLEYAIVASLLAVSALVLVHTAVSTFDGFNRSGGFATTTIGAIDGILVVIILLDIVQTVFRHVRNAAFPVRPFLVIGILAAIRDILSASAHLALSVNLGNTQFHNTLIELGIGVAAVLALLFGLWLLRLSGHQDDG
ncbi:MAG: phosphate-starvation-inducible PsiE family protein [Acidimicrobiales bacterium]